MILKQIDLNTDYELLCSWWNKRNFPCMPKEALTDYGYMVSSGDNDIAAVWLYPIITSKLCWFGFFISNKDVAPEIRNEAMDYLISGVENKARDMGYDMIMTVSGNEKVQKRLEKNNYNIGQINSIEYLKGL